MAGEHTADTATGHVAILGAGTVGTHLGLALEWAGYQIVYGARDPSSAKVVSALAEVPGATATSIAEAVTGADLAFLAVPYRAIGEVLDSAGDLGDTVLVDATNAGGATLPEGCASIVDVIRRERPDATVVKAFNTIGAEAYVAPVIDGHPLFLPIAGPQPAAGRVEQLASTLGFDALVVGGPEAAPMLEEFARLWIHLALRMGLGRNFGFARLARGAS